MPSQVVTVVHTAFDVNVADVVWYVVTPLHVVTAVQTRFDVSVGAAV